MSRLEDFANGQNLDQKNNINLIKILVPDQQNQQFFMCDTADTRYLNKNFRYLDFSISGDEENSSGERVRPTLTIANPNGLFTALALSGNLLGALVVRYQVNVNASHTTVARLIKTNQWKVYQVSGVSTTLVLQLRSLIDSPKHKIPLRQYYPPMFNHVNV